MVCGPRLVSLLLVAQAMTISHSDLYRIQFAGATSKERVDARKILDAERVRLYNLDRATGSSLLLKWTRETTEGFVMPDIEIEDNVPAPEAAAPKKRGRKPGTKNPVSQGAGLLAALDHVAFVKSEAYEFSAFVALANNTAIAYNNIMAAGHPIQETLHRSVSIPLALRAATSCNLSSLAACSQWLKRLKYLGGAIY